MTRLTRDLSLSEIKRGCNATEMSKEKELHFRDRVRFECIQDIPHRLKQCWKIKADEKIKFDKNIQPVKYFS